MNRTALFWTAYAAIVAALWREIYGCGETGDGDILATHSAGSSVTD